MEIQYVGSRPFHRITLGHTAYNFNSKNKQTVEVPEKIYNHFIVAIIEGGGNVADYRMILPTPPKATVDLETLATKTTGTITGTIITTGTDTTKKLKKRGRKPKGA